MIINVRSTSGGGKTHLVRSVMEGFSTRTSVFAKPVAGERARKRPIGYICNRPGWRSLAVVGHYETACGGCDTIPEMEMIFRLVRDSHAAGMNVLFEGLLISADVNRTLALHTDGLPLRVIALDTPLQTCLDSINARRLQAHERRVQEIVQANIKRRSPIIIPDPPGPVSEANTTSKFKGVHQSMQRLLAAGVDAVTLSRADAASNIKRVLWA